MKKILLNANLPKLMQYIQPVAHKLIFICEFKSKWTQKNLLSPITFFFSLLNIV